MDEMMFLIAGIPKDVKMKICDMGYYNEVMKGYLIVAMENAGFGRVEIDRAIRGMSEAHSEKTAAEAEKVYFEW